MDRFAAMTAFVQVAERLSFAAAGRHLNLSPPSVTRLVSGLENRLGARLFTRTTRSVRLTEAGRRYLEDCRRILAEIEEADNSAAGLHGELRGELSVTASQLFGRIFMLPIVTRFLAEHEGVTVRTLFTDRIVSLIEEGIDVAVRIGDLPSSSLSAQRVGSVRRVVCASAEYLARNGTPESPEDLQRHRLVSSSASQSDVEWRFFRSGAAVDVPIRPRLITTANEAAIDAARAGWGLARLLSYQVAPDVAAGRLSIVLADFEPPPLPVHLVHAEGRRASAKLRTFVDLAAELLRRNALIDA